MLGHVVPYNNDIRLNGWGNIYTTTVTFDYDGWVTIDDSREIYDTMTFDVIKGDSRFRHR